MSAHEVRLPRGLMRAAGRAVEVGGYCSLRCFARRAVIDMLSGATALEPVTHWDGGERLGPRMQVMLSADHSRRLRESAEALGSGVGAYIRLAIYRAASRYVDLREHGQGTEAQATLGRVRRRSPRETMELWRRCGYSAPQARAMGIGRDRLHQLRKKYGADAVPYATR